MKAFVFKPSNEFVVKFDVATQADIHAALEIALSKNKSITQYCYMEADGKVWTITEIAPLQLQEGRVTVPPPITTGNKLASIPSEKIELQSKKDSGERDMIVGGCWCIGGILVTALTYSTAASDPNGGRYVIAWGAILFGGIQFIKGLFKSI